MTSSSIEQQIRGRLWRTRFIQAYLPLPIAQWLIQQILPRVRLEADVRRETILADGVPCEWIIPRGSPEAKVLIYLHGGGFVYGLSPPHLEMVAYLTQKMGIRALMVDYRLAPDYPFPAALDDCLTAYRWLVKEGVSAQNIVVGGDSAGGNLVITMMMKLRDGGDELPAAAACLSPVGILTDRSNSYEEIDDPLLHPKAVRMYNRSYVAGHDPQNPYISPVFGDFDGLPPLLVFAGEDEILRDDAVRIEALAMAAGVDVRLEIYPRMWHVWQLYLSLPQAVQSLEDTSQFFKTHLG